MGNQHEDGIMLYEHPLGKEMGRIDLVMPAPYDPEDDEGVILILTSEESVDEGVVFAVELYKDDYEDMCKGVEVETLEGCILSKFGEDISIKEVPEDPPAYRPNAPQEGSKLRVLTTPNMWRHDWGRCCCVKHGGELVPVTREAINTGTVPFWRSPFTPYELDLIDAALHPEDKPMHVLLDNEMICGNCGSPVWVVYPEEVPEEMPEPPLYIEVEDSLCDDQQALEEIEWSSKRDAWEIFYEDDHNNSVIQKSQLAVERSNKRKRFSQEKLFKAFNAAHGLGHKIHTVKQAFYAALGPSKTGTWADFDLKMLRMIKGLKKVDLPAEILEMVRLEDQDAGGGSRDKGQRRAVKATVDHDATILEFLLDEEAAGNDTIIDVDIFDDTDDSDDDPEIKEPEPQKPRPKAVPRVQRSNKKPPERPVAKQRPSSTKPSKKKEAAKADLIAACKMLQEALSSFVQVLQDEEEEPLSEETKKAEN